MDDLGLMLASFSNFGVRRPPIFDWGEGKPHLLIRRPQPHRAAGGDRSVNSSCISLNIQAWRPGGMIPRHSRSGSEGGKTCPPCRSAHNAVDCTLLYHRARGGCPWVPRGPDGDLRVVTDRQYSSEGFFLARVACPQGEKLARACESSGPRYHVRHDLVSIFFCTQCFTN